MLDVFSKPFSFLILISRYFLHIPPFFIKWNEAFDCTHWLKYNRSHNNFSWEKILLKNKEKIIRKWFLILNFNYNLIILFPSSDIFITFNILKEKLFMMINHIKRWLKIILDSRYLIVGIDTNSKKLFEFVTTFIHLNHVENTINKKKKSNHSSWSHLR